MSSRGTLGQHLAAGLRHEDVVFDPHAAEAGHVRAGFDGKDHAWHERHGRDVRTRAA